jgi:hypothetical protein
MRALREPFAWLGFTADYAIANSPYKLFQWGRA